jgi:hypothetical protein
MDGDNEVEEGFNNEEVEDEGQNSPTSELRVGGSVRYAAGSSREQLGPNLRVESNRWMEGDGWSYNAYGVGWLWPYGW